MSKAKKTAKGTVRRAGAKGLPEFYVRASRCDQCLFSPKRIVSGARMKEVLEDCRKRDTHFVCHKNKIGMCRGFYETQPAPSTLRIAQAFARLGLGRIVFIDREVQ